MKRALIGVVALALAVTACGLKVPVTLVEGAGPVSGDTGNSPIAGGPDTTDPDAIATLGPDATTPSTGPTTGGPLVPASGLFANETEGVTKDRITLCTHVPITGAAPVARHADRFGQFYFDHVNEKGGIYGRKVRFLAFDDQYYPAGARAAVEKCAREGAFIYIGAAGTDQIVSVAKWAERKKVPYWHGPTSDKDMRGFKYNIFGAPTYEDQHRLLADYLVKKYGKNKRYGMIRVSSPFFDAGHDAYVDQLKKHGVTLTVDKVVQKDEQQFNDIYFELSKPGSEVDIVNNFTTPNIWIRMLAQKQPPSYNPLWTAVSPVAGFNLVALALKNSNSRAEVFSTVNPACNCTDYQADLDRTAPWYEDEQKFLTIFKKYSPEKTPRPDDFDYAAYLAGKTFERVLRALGPNPTRSGLLALLKTYNEKPSLTFPSCGLDFTRQPNLRRGAHHVNVFELKAGKWKQVETCMDKV